MKLCFCLFGKVHEKGNIEELSQNTSPLVLNKYLSENMHQLMSSSDFRLPVITGGWHLIEQIISLDQK